MASVTRRVKENSNLFPYILNVHDDGYNLRISVCCHLTLRRSVKSFATTFRRNVLPSTSTLQVKSNMFFGNDGYDLPDDVASNGNRPECSNAQL